MDKKMMNKIELALHSINKTRKRLKYIPYLKNKVISI